MESLTMRVPAAALSFLLLVVPFGASALGLASIEVDSGLNEPLEARIDLRSLQPGDLEGMQVTLGTAEQFQRAGIDRPFLLSRLKFEIVDRGAGQAHIRVATDKPVLEPFLNFLVEVTWPRGRIIREYTVLLDPPVYGARIAAAARERAATVRRAEAPAPEAPAPLPAPPAAPPAAPAPVEAPSMPAPAEPPAAAAAPALPPPEPAAAPEPEPTAPAMAAAEPMIEPEPVPAPAEPTFTPELAPDGYEVRRGDTLWSLATRYRPDESVSINRMMLAMLDANPEAFAFPNVNSLRAGAVLRIPDRGELSAESRDAILAEVNRQHGLWDEYRRDLSTAVAEAPEGTMVEGTPGEAPASAEASAPGGEAQAGDAGEAPSTAAGGGETPAGTSGEDDRLELVSAGDATAGVGTTSSDSEDAASLRQELTLAEEETDARRREAEELSEKLREAEQIIEQQTRLLELRDDNIAALQEMLAKAEAEAERLREAAEQAGAAAPPEAATSTGAPEAAVTPEPSQVEAPEAEPQPAEPPAPAQTTEPEPAEPPAPAQTAEPEPAAPPEASEPAEPASPPETSEPQETAVAGAEPAAPEPAQQPAPEQRKKLVPPPPPPPPSFLETMLESLPVDPVLLGAGVGGLLVVLGGAALWRRRRGTADEEEDLDELEAALTEEERAILAQYGDGAEPAFEELAPEVEAPAAAPTEDDVETDLSSTLISAPGTAAGEGGDDEDPLTEVNVYLAYERYDQAEELVRSAIQQYPERHEYKLRLLEVFYAAKDTASFERTARELRDAVGDGSPLLAEAQKMWQDMSPGRGLFDSAESTVPEDQEVAFDITGPESRADATIPLGTGEAADEASSVDFDLGFESEAAGGAGTGSEDSSVDFDLGFEEAEEKTEPASEAGLDFDLGGIGGEEQAAGGSGSSSLDFDLTEIDSGDEAGAAESAGKSSSLDLDLGGLGEEGGEADVPLVERAAGDDELEFDMGDFEERTLIDSQGPPRFGEEEAAAGSDEQGGDLDIDLASLEDESPAGDTGAASLDADVTALDFDLGAAADAGGTAGAPSGESSGLDLDFDMGGGEAAETPAEQGFDIGGEGLEQPTGGAASMDEELDFGLNLDEAAGAEEDVSAKSLDLSLSLDEEEGGEDAFDTVKLRHDDSAEGGAAEPGIDTDFEDVFDAGAGGGADAGDDDEMSLSMDLADLTPEATPEKDMSTDLPEIDLDFDSGGEEPAQDEYEATQFMLRDVPPESASEEGEDSEQGRTLMLGGGLTGEVDEIQTKLDLAQAYIDMGDNDGAKGILDEVIAEGNDAQKQAAMGLLGKLAGA